MPAGKRLLTPDNCALLLIDHQSQMLFGVQSHNRALTINAVVARAKDAGLDSWRSEEFPVEPVESPR